MELINSSNLALLTGFVGTLTGISGSIMGFIAYRRSNFHKLSDRRVEVYKLRNNTETACSALLELISKALASRRWTFNNHGALNSSMYQLYEKENSKDSSRAKELLSVVPTDDSIYDQMQLLELEREIVNLDKIKVEVDSLASKYQESIKEDRHLNSKKD